ncbi:MAG: hypothetical protein IJL38_01210 [Bacteroidales bacterium]|nr:hypothetical protein [Bacteroidales bacterium]
MKYILKVICILSVSVLFCGCEKICSRCGWRVLDCINNADYEISVYSMSVDENQSRGVIYPDTTLPNIPPLRIIDIDPRESKNVISTHDQWDSFYEQFGTDTISFFILSTDTLNEYGWTNIKNTYRILQRYDLSISDLEAVHFRLPFPPNKIMKTVKMWPPYGTYDATGHRVDTTGTK